MESLQQLADLNAVLDEQERPATILTAVTDRAPVVMCQISRKADSHLSIQWASGSWQRLLGWDPSAVEGMNLRSLAHPADAMTLARLALQPTGANVALRLRTPTNQYRSCSATWARNDGGDSIFATIMCPQ